jgi:hypothetical protein
MIAPAGGRGGRSSPPPRGPGPKLLTTAANSIAAEPAPATGVKRPAILVSTSLAIGGGKKRVHSVPRGASVNVAYRMMRIGPTLRHEWISLRRQTCDRGTRWSTPRSVAWMDD